MQTKLIRLEFKSKIIFQRTWHERPWRVPSDYLVRSLVYAWSKLYGGPNELVQALIDDHFGISSLLIARRDKLFLPDYGTHIYATIEGDEIIDPAELVTELSRVRVARDMNEPTPFEEYLINALKYEWAVIISFSESFDLNKLIASFRLLGDLGIGGRKSKGGGRFRLTSVDSIDRYNLEVKCKGFGRLISRYLPTCKEVEGKIYQESVTIWYGPGKSHSYVVIPEGSEVNVVDDGQVIFVENDLNHRVPIFFRPLIAVVD